jgi:bacteriocin-like protein
MSQQDAARAIHQIEAHEQSIRGVTDQDVRDHLAELSENDLDNVSGGILIGLSLPSIQNLSPRQGYLLALGSALKQGISDGVPPSI